MFAGFVDVTLEVFTAILNEGFQWRIYLRSPNEWEWKKCRLADLVTELGFSCEKNRAKSNSMCAKCATKIRNASELMRYLRSGFLVPQEHPFPWLVHLLLWNILSECPVHLILEKLAEPTHRRNLK